MNGKSIEAERALKVAWSSLKDVEAKLDQLKQASEVDYGQQGGFSGAVRAGALKGALESEMKGNLELAWKQAETAERISPDGSAEVSEGVATVTGVKSLVCSLRGDMQFVQGKWDAAIGHYKQALQYDPDDAHSYADLGAAYANKHVPEEAIKAFSKVIELDGAGDLAVQATKHLEKIKAGKLGQKAFSGSWKVLAVLAGLTVLAVVGGIGQGNYGGAFVTLVLFGGATALYWKWKYK